MLSKIQDFFGQGDLKNYFFSDLKKSLKNNSPAQGTIEEFFGKKFSKKSIAQGTIEYLVIIAIVVIIALVVVALLIGLFSPAEGVGTGGQQLQQRTQTLSLTESVVSPSGDFLLEITSLEAQAVTIDKITIGDEDQNYYSLNALNVGTKRYFPVSTGMFCASGTNVTTDIVIEYTTRSGLKRKHTMENVVVPCSEFNITDDLTLAQTTPLDQRLCTDDNWSYIDGDCQPEGILTRTWEKIGNCQDGIQKPDTEEVSCEYSSEEYRLFISLSGGSNTVTVNGNLFDPEERFTYNQQVILEAIPQEGWIFTNWSQAIDTSENPTTITMNETKYITANFELEQTDFTIDLIYPHNNQEFDLETELEIEFEFVVNSENEVEYCELIFDGAQEEYSDDINLDVQEHFYYNIEGLNPGEYDAKIVCEDIHQNQAESQTITIKLTSTNQILQLRQGLIGYWPLDETEGTTVYDYSGNNNHGIASHSRVIGGEGILGLGADFSQGNDNINIGNSSIFNFIDENFTISLWVKFSSSSSGTLLQRGASQQRGYTIMADSTFHFLTHQSGTYTYIRAGTQKGINVWEHWVAIKEGNEFRLYKNSIENTPYTHNQAAVNPVSSSDPLILGHGSWNFLNGYLDEVAIWDRALSEDEIEALYNGGDGLSLVLEE